MSSAMLQSRPVEPERLPSSRGASRGSQGSGAAEPGVSDRTAAKQPRISRNATDEEIFMFQGGTADEPPLSLADSDRGDDLTRAASSREPEGDAKADAQRSNLEAALSTNPELRRAWDDAKAYRESFATPEEARKATAALADLDRMDALFYSDRREDHAELARGIAALNPAAFNSLARAMAEMAGTEQQAGHATAASSEKSAEAKTGENRDSIAREERRAATSHGNRADSAAGQPTPNAAHVEFFRSTNEAAVRTVIQAIESQVQRLLPEGLSTGAKNRVVGEIYRELDMTLRSNRQLAQQASEAFRSGAMDEDHRNAVVSLIAGRARQALPAVAKRVLNEWTSTIVAANQDRRVRQRVAERRIDIAGSGRTGNDGYRPITRDDINYARMSDADILNL
jgi:hypothetical protein